MDEKVEAIADQMIRLNQQTREIVNITSIVSDLANQLADQSKNSTEKINRLIFNIQEAINMSVTVTEDGKRTADASIKISQETGEAFLRRCTGN